MIDGVKTRRKRLTKAEREAKDKRFMARVWEEHTRLRLKPWQMVTPLFTMGRSCPPDERDKAHWEEMRRQFHELLQRDPHFYDDVL